MNSQAQLPEESSYDDLPDELKQIIVEEISQFKDFCALRTVSRRWSLTASTSPLFGTHSFFQRCFSRVPESIEYIRTPESLTLASIRRGNFLTNSTMDILLSGDRTKMLTGERMLFSAAFLTGNPLAMRLLNMLFDLPGRSQKYRFSDKLIQQYADNTALVLEAAYKKHFSEEKWDDCRYLLNRVLYSIEAVVNIYINVYRSYYLTHSGISPLNCKPAHDGIIQFINATGGSFPPELDGRQITDGFTEMFDAGYLFAFGIGYHYHDERWHSTQELSNKNENAFYVAIDQQNKESNKLFITYMSRPQ